jgi:hypothetical protein
LPTPPGRHNCVIGNEKKERIPAPSPSIDERTIAAMPKIKKYLVLEGVGATITCPSGS